MLGTNSRLDELQAAVLRVKLRALDRWNEARRRHAASYRKAFERRRLPGVILPQERPGYRAVYHLYVVRMPRRDAVQRRLADRGIATQVAYPSTLPAQPALRAHVKPSRRLPHAERAAREVLALPMYPELTPDLIERVVEEIARALRRSP